MVRLGAVRYGLVGLSEAQRAMSRCLELYMIDTRITEDIILIEKYIKDTWKHFTTVKEVRLSKLFPEPENKGLKHIWTYGSADLVVYRNDKPIAIIEAGGGQHFKEKQSLNDRRKWKLCDINNAPCLTMINGLKDQLSNRQWRALLGKYLFKVIREDAIPPVWK